MTPRPFGDKRLPGLTQEVPVNVTYSVNLTKQMLRRRVPASLTIQMSSSVWSARHTGLEADASRRCTKGNAVVQEGAEDYQTEEDHVAFFL